MEGNQKVDQSDADLRPLKRQKLGDSREGPTEADLTQNKDRDQQVLCKSDQRTAEDDPPKSQKEIGLEIEPPKVQEGGIQDEEIDWTFEPLPSEPHDPGDPGTWLKRERVCTGKGKEKVEEPSKGVASTFFLVPGGIAPAYPEGADVRKIALDAMDEVWDQLSGADVPMRTIMETRSVTDGYRAYLNDPRLPDMPFDYKNEPAEEFIKRVKVFARWIPYMVDQVKDSADKRLQTFLFMGYCGDYNICCCNHEESDPLKEQE